MKLPLLLLCLFWLPIVIIGTSCATRMSPDECSGESAMMNDLPPECYWCIDELLCTESEAECWQKTNECYPENGCHPIGLWGTLLSGSICIIVMGMVSWFWVVLVHIVLLACLACIARLSAPCDCISSPLRSWVRTRTEEFSISTRTPNRSLWVFVWCFFVVTFSLPDDWYTFQTIVLMLIVGVMLGVGYPLLLVLVVWGFCTYFFRYDICSSDDDNGLLMVECDGTKVDGDDATTTTTVDDEEGPKWRMDEVKGNEDDGKAGDDDEGSPNEDGHDEELHKVEMDSDADDFKNV
jgi:hypothetical protein